MIVHDVEATLRSPGPSGLFVPKPSCAPRAATAAAQCRRRGGVAARIRIPRLNSRRVRLGRSQLDLRVLAAANLSTLDSYIPLYFVTT